MTRRWNGWGDDQIVHAFPQDAAQYLSSIVGCGIRNEDAPFENVLNNVPESRLPDHASICTNKEDRALHARGQSLPDWIELRHGTIRSFPDGVAYPEGDEDIIELIHFARLHQACLIPYGGGTSVLGHINTLLDGSPAIIVDLSRLNKLIKLDKKDLLATFQAGIAGPTIEAALNREGFTLGHFPQSFEYSTLGGWIATRSCGQQSHYYGRIEDLFVGGKLLSPNGELDFPAFNASAAGPDLRQLILGSEGRLGFITTATVRIQNLPKVNAFFGIIFRDWEEAVEAVRKITQGNIPVSMLRLSDPHETEITLKLSGKDKLVRWGKEGLKILGFGDQLCLLIFGITSHVRDVSSIRSETISIARDHGGLFVGKMIGNIWKQSRFRTPYLRNNLWEAGYALDTLETVLPWSKVISFSEIIVKLLRDCLKPKDESVLAFAHLSHEYNNGASIYVTYLFRRSFDPAVTLENWKILKSAASQLIVRDGGTISHQHGVGVDHLEYLPFEKGESGMALLKSCSQSLDPDGLMNPGKLFL